MAGLKEAFLFIAVVAFSVQGYYIWSISPELRRGIYFHDKRDVSKTRIMANTISHNVIGHTNLNHTDKGMPVVLHDSRVFSADKSRTDKVETLPSKASREGQCHYKVQIYDKKGKARKAPVLQSIVQQLSDDPVKSSYVMECGNKCQMELTIADDSNKFTGMDAVVFHFVKSLIPRPQPPVSMNPNQTWVYFSWESPRSNAGEAVGTARLPVQATWTYHRSSEIVTPYGLYRRGVPMATQTKTPEEWVKGKKRLVAWMASNCAGTFWPRTAFVKELQKYIPVDTYGACGTLKCKPSWSTKCTVDLMRQYKFYLSLENAECGDYITEKLWNKPLTQGVVPIVYGPPRKVYEDLAPPNSFIYIGDYKNMQELADHLKLLDSNPKLYAKYFEWQYQGSIEVPKKMHESYKPSLFCNLIPVIEKVRRGELKRVPVRNSAFAQACRKPDKTKVSAFGLGKWNPW
ncbi:alpha-(1,3)-fucosyltransferase 7-like isoform X1 [Asterias amurensis]|uniref:alpha-(1,3)-fucosyltransferase 7-like isoform X1 n=2 Tax=Asterias amurensis TaxID=7602 RepID=UPI003AB66418